MLFGLAAASLPLLIHLLSIRKLRTIEFSSLRFLKELQRSSIRRVRIKQWLLLLLRTLLIIAIVFAFARPALRGSFAGLTGGHASTAMVLLLDDSPSTTARNARGEMFPQLRDAAIAIGNLAQEGDEVFVIRLSDFREKSDFLPVRATEDLHKSIAAAEPTQGRIAFRMALGKAAEVLSKTNAANRELYLLTDAQANQFDGRDSSADSTHAFGGIHLFVVHPKAAQGVNGGLTSAEILTQVVTKTRPVELQAGITNPGSVGPLSSVAGIYLAGTRVAQQSFDIQQGSASTIHARFVARQTGVVAGYVQLEDDALDIDNRRFFTMAVPARVNVLLAGNTQGDLQFIKLGLTLGGDSSIAGLFSMQSVLEDNLAGADVNAFDVLCFSNIARFTPTTSETIARFVRSGGGLVIFLGGNVDLGNYNTTIFPKMGIPSAMPQPQTMGDTASGHQGLSVRHIDIDHPLFDGMFDDAPRSRRGTIESPLVRHSVRLNVGERGHSIMTLSTQLPFLAEFSSGDGRILVFSVDAAGAWSDFPTSALFAPLVYRSMIYLTDAARNVPPLIVGNPIETHLRLQSDGGHSSFAFVSPSGVPEKVVPEFSPSSGAATFRSRPTSETGIYRLVRVSSYSPQSATSGSGDPLASIAVNVDTAESDLRQADQQTIESFFHRMGIDPQDLRILPTGESPEVIIEQSRFGVELWRLFVGTALLLALIEVAVGNSLRRRENQEPGQHTEAHA